MLKYVKVKKLLKGTIFPLFTLVNKMIPKRDTQILLYSPTEGVRHSLIPIKNYLLENNYDQKYRIVCGIEKMKYAGKDTDRVDYCSQWKSVFCFLRTKHVFYSAGQIPIKPSKGQIVIHLGHGNASFKTGGALTNIKNGDEMFFTYMAATSDLFCIPMMKGYKCTREQIAIVGDPQLDRLFLVKEKYDLGEYRKVLLWVPTFRKSDYLGYDDSDMEELIPLFTEAEYDMLNRYLADRDIKVIVKLHPMQDLRGGKIPTFSHFDIYSDLEFKKRGLELYNLMAQVDGLIGDYSSASLQYLLIDKPQAYVIPDIETYSKKRGFQFDNPEDYMAGHIIKEKKEFWTFIDDMAEGRDPYKEKRNKVRNEVFLYQDHNNCKRIIELSEISMKN